MIKVYNGDNANIGISDPFPARDATQHMHSAMDQAMAHHLMQDCHTAEQALKLEHVRKEFQSAASRESRRSPAPATPGCADDGTDLGDYAAEPRDRPT